MPRNHIPDACDVLLHLSAESAGKAEIDEFLRTNGKSPKGKCFRKIIKRIRHEDLYSQGKLSKKAAALAVILLLLLTLALSAVVLCFAKLTDSILSAGNVRELFHVNRDYGEQTGGIWEIDTYRKPHMTESYEERVLVLSRLLYSVEYITEKGKIYYSQRPVTLSGKEKNMPSADAITVFVGKNLAEIESYEKDGEKFFDIHWSDNSCTYSIYSAETIEQAVELANSVYTQTDDLQIAESATEKHSEF